MLFPPVARGFEAEEEDETGGEKEREVEKKEEEWKEEGDGGIEREEGLEIGVD